MGIVRAGSSSIGTVGQSSTPIIDGCLKFDGWKGQYFRRTFSTSGNRRKWTISCWTRVNPSEGLFSNINHRCWFGADAGAASNASRFLCFVGDASDQLQLDLGSASIRDSSSRYRDPEGWYHHVVKLDSAQSGAAAQLAWYINGVQVTTWNTETAVTVSEQLGWNNSASTHMIGANPAAGPGQYFEGYMSQFYHLDGQALGPENFGFTDPLTGVWRPKTFQGSYGDTGGTPTSGTLLNYNSNTALPTYSNQGGGTSTGGTTTVNDGFDSDSGTYADMTYLNGQWSKLTFQQAITNVTNITVGYDGEGDPGYNGGNVQTGVSFNGSRQTIQLYNGGAITLTDLYFISQPGSGVCRLYDVTITTTGASATELTFVPGQANNSFYLPFDGNSPAGKDQSPCGNDWQILQGKGPLDKATGAFPILNTTASGGVDVGGVRKDYSPQTPPAVVGVGGTASGGCVGFNGSSEALTLANSSDFSFGSGNFTVEGWVYCKGATTGTSQVIASFYDTGDNKRSWQLTRHGSGNNIRFYYSTDGSTGLNIADSSNTLEGEWQHIAVVRNSNALNLYINGTSVANATVSGSLYDNTSDVLVIGASDAGGTTSKYLDGLISNLRIVKGTAVYTSNFTPPGESLTGITNTKLLCCQSSTDPTEASVKPGALTKIGTPYATDSESSAYLVLALPLNGSTTDVSDLVNASNTALAITNNNSATFNSTQDKNACFYGNFLDLERDSSQYLSWSSTKTAPDSGDFTYECWVWVEAFTNYMAIMDARASAGDAAGFFWGFNNGGKYYIYCDSAIAIEREGLSIKTWYHCAVSRKGDQFRMFLDGNVVGTVTKNNNFNVDITRLGSDVHSAGYYFDGMMCDARIYIGTAKYVDDFIPASPSPDFLAASPVGAALASKTRRPASGAVSLTGASGTSYLNLATSAGDIAIGTGDFTIEAFVYHVGGADDTIISPATGCTFTYGAASKLRFYVDNGSNVVDANTNYISNRWVHVAVCRASSTLAFYQDGKQVGTHGSYTNDIGDFSNPTYIGKYHGGASQTFEGCMSNLRVVVGTALYNSATYTVPSEPLKNITNTKLLCCNSSNNIVTEFTVSPGAITATGNASPTPFSPFRTTTLGRGDAIDTVLGEPGWYPTYNPLAIESGGGEFYSKQGNLRVDSNSSNAHARTNITLRSGKWYWEIYAYALNNQGSSLARVYFSPQESTSYYVKWNENGTTNWNGSPASTPTFSSFTTGDTLGLAMDLSTTTPKFGFYKNGVMQGDGFYAGDPASRNIEGNVVGDGMTPGTYLKSADDIVDINFGQIPFKYGPPEGFLPINGPNLERVGISTHRMLPDPKHYFGMTTYTGNGTSGRKLSFDFSPDLVWFKSRNTTHGWECYDSVRGPTKAIYNNLNNAEATESEGLLNFQDGCVTIGNNNWVNKTSDTYIAYAWKAGGSENTFNVDGHGFASYGDTGLPTGSVTPTGISVGKTNGLSIIKYSGTTDTATIPHGLGEIPTCIIFKNLSATDDWGMYHQGASDGASKWMYFSTDAQRSAGNTSAFNNTMPTNNVFTVKTEDNFNASGENFIAYAWVNRPGMQKFGWYWGNGNNSGSYVYLGFRPAMIIVKDTVDNGTNWGVNDSLRDPTNGQWGNDLSLYNNSNVAETTSASLNVDFVSNGFKLRSNNNAFNENGSLFIYCAWSAQAMSTMYGSNSVAV